MVCVCLCTCCLCVTGARGDTCCALDITCVWCCLDADLADMFSGGSDDETISDVSPPPQPLPVSGARSNPVDLDDWHDGSLADPMVLDD